MKKSLGAVCMALLIIAASIYMSAWDSSREDTFSPVRLSAEEEAAVLGDGEEESAFQLESRLVGTKQIQDKGVPYKVETYREYEIYKDASGQIIKELPTENFSYLRYREGK
ncbi:hypothetical protein GKZ89_13160 [Bacillus mangrovi]|uniref:DUF3139 domain-containing protein n=1 Tax=Metabacillus mangrovi TaxID=1491830 RepID=A0A7X2S639_9BACI|nr:hypothetical protein [Metabacillus mangrovi]MTH54354.1 hypothetical protein [Metabacillus mangrovi]